MTENTDKPEKQVTSTEVQVTVARSVRYNRLLLVGAVFGAVIAVLVTTLFPVVPEGHYTLSEVVGFMGILGAAAGLLCGGILGLILNLFAKRKQGTATAIQEDVR